MNEPLAKIGDKGLLPTDLASLILPHTVRLERVSVRRELSIEDALRDEARDPRDRLGLAGERFVTALLEKHTALAWRRVLCWDTPVQRDNLIELDGVSLNGRAFLEIKWTVNPERVFPVCARQLLNASEIYHVCGDEAPRGVGVIVDCGPLVGKAPYHATKTVAEVIQIIESGTEALSLCVLPYDEFAESILASPYAELLSYEGVRAALSGMK